MTNYLEQEQKKAEKNAKIREKKKKPKMRVSGRSVFKLNAIIKKKAKLA